MKIGELARLTGCPVTRIRFYEQKGLLPEPKRTMGGQRNYSQDAVERLNFITTCRANGMKLECIERFIEFEKEPSRGTDWLLERVDDYLAMARDYRQKLLLAEKSCFICASSFPKTYWPSTPRKTTDFSILQVVKRKLFKNPCSQAELNKIVPFGFSLQRQKKMVFFLPSK